MKILIVDDSQFFKNLLIKMLREYLPDALILAASNGQQGYEIYLEEKPDFVITDLLMPEKNGHELLQLLKNSEHKAKVIVLSADIQKSTRDEVEAMGALAFINKPLNDEKATRLVNLLKKEGSDA